MGAIIGFGVLVLGKVVLLDGSLRDLTDLLTPIEWSTVLLMFPFMAGVGGLVSAVTAWVTLRFYLRV
jgi:cell division transport system permease protein